MNFSDEKEYEFVGRDDIEVMGCVLKSICYACPESYDVYKNSEYFGYLRLRHGTFRAEDKYGEVIYTANPIGDGIFQIEERDRYLIEAVTALLLSEAEEGI